MSLYTIGDLHLHFGSELKAKNQIEGKVWQNHEEIFRVNCEKLIRPEDTLVHSLVSGDCLRWHPMKVL